MEEKRSLWSEFTKGIIKENPVLRLILGCCATLAVTTAASNAIGMGAAKAFSPALDTALGVFLPLIVVNCIILGRAEMFASKNKVLPSIIDGLGMGVGFTAAMLAMGIIRELLGAGTVFGLPVLSGFMEPVIIFLLPPGGFFVFGMLIALAGKLSKEGKAPASTGCAHCPLAASCSKKQEKEAAE